MTRITLTIAGEPRQFWLLAPAAPTPVPLVLALHGAGATAEWAAEETRWPEAAARHGFALALPEGTAPNPEHPPRFLSNPQRWNDGSQGPTGEPAITDDVEFLAAVIRDAANRVGIDRSRVYVTGFSNGAGMAFRATAELADQIAAVAPVAGYCWVPEPKPSRPVPTLYIIGSADPLVPLRGGDVRSPWLHRYIRRQPVSATLERWANAIGCDPAPIAEGEAHGAWCERYPGPVEFRTMIVEGQGHHWPGGLGRLNHKIGGASSGTFDATEAIWEFFQRHTLNPGPPVTGPT